MSWHADYHWKVSEWRHRKGFDLSSFEEALRHLRSRSDGDGLALMDFGCNDGAVQELLMSACPGMSAVGFDTNHEAVSHGKSLGRDVRLLAYGHMPDTGAAFDVITCYSVISHIAPAHRGPVLSGLCGLLKPGGLMIVETPDPAYDRIRRMELELRGYRGDPTIVSPVSEPELVGLMTSSDMTHCCSLKTGRKLPWAYRLVSSRTSDCMMVFRKDGRS